MYVRVCRVLHLSQCASTCATEFERVFQFRRKRQKKRKQQLTTQTHTHTNKPHPFVSHRRKPIVILIFY